MSGSLAYPIYIILYITPLNKSIETDKQKYEKSEWNKFLKEENNIIRQRKQKTAKAVK
ncbi:MAG: hypothetical protein WCR95_04990 [Eubacteriales bacterium]